MLDSLKKRPGSLRWPPRQRFTLTESGRTALAEYTEAIERYHASGQGREQLEAAERGWAQNHKVEGRDAAVLGEFAGRERLPREVHTALEDCGVSLADVQAAVDRLYTAGLLDPVGGGGPLSGDPRGPPA